MMQQRSIIAALGISCPPKMKNSINHFSKCPQNDTCRITKYVTGAKEDARSKILAGRRIRSENPCLCHFKGHLVLFFLFILRDYWIVKQLFSGSTNKSDRKPACRPDIQLFGWKVSVTCWPSEFGEPIVTGVSGQSAFPLQQNYEQDGWLSHDINIYLSMCPSRNELRGMWLKGCVIHAFNSIDLLI